MMKRVILLLFPICLSVFLFSFIDHNETLPKAQIKTLIIDPGHGGIDPGAKGNFSYEADVSLAVSLKFGKALEEQFPDLKIVYTRTTDVMAGNKRTKNIKAFISSLPIRGSRRITSSTSPTRNTASTVRRSQSRAERSMGPR